MSMLKLGKAPPRIDRRTITLSTVLKALPPPPDEYSVDQSLNAIIPTPMLGNDAWGDCVVAGSGHQLFRFEYVEQKKCIKITANNCLQEYWREQGYRAPFDCDSLEFLRPVKPDNGLVTLDHLNVWRKAGWKIGGRTYRIYAYASALEELDIKLCIQYLYGAQVGVSLPKSAEDQFKAGLPWTVDAGSPSVGGHLIYCEKYDPDWLECITWGKKQLMSWDFFNKYRDESYGVVTNRNIDDPSNPIDVTVLDEILAKITS